MSIKRISLKLLALFCGLAVVYMTMGEHREMKRVRAMNKTAEVLPISTYKVRKGTYTAEFTFETEDSNLVKKSTSFPKELIEDFNSGTPVLVNYDPHNPSHFYFEKDEASWIVPGFLIALMVVAVLFV